MSIVNDKDLWHDLNDLLSAYEFRGPPFKDIYAMRISLDREIAYAVSEALWAISVDCLKWVMCRHDE